MGRKLEIRLDGVTQLGHPFPGGGRGGGGGFRGLDEGINRQRGYLLA